MKLYVAIGAAALTVGLLITLVFANPTMLPKHPGYPGGNAVSPVNGQPLTNDPGQTNASGEKALQQAASAEDAHVAQNLNDPNNQRIIQTQGAGQLPKVQGPNIKIEPPVKEGTRMK